jgi:hypothetical protein
MHCIFTFFCREALPGKVIKKQEKKAKREKNLNLIQEVSGYWEVLRQGNTPKDKKRELVGKILDACGDRVADVAASHTASRIIQSCVKHGDASQRLVVQKAILGGGRGVVELAKNPYSRFVVSKLISTAPKDQLGGTLLVTSRIREIKCDDCLGQSEYDRALGHGRACWPGGGLAGEVTKLRYLPERSIRHERQNVVAEAVKIFHSILRFSHSQTEIPVLLDVKPGSVFLPYIPTGHDPAERRCFMISFSETYSTISGDSKT